MACITRAVLRLISSMNVLSCFDGMSCGQLALRMAGVKYQTYFASEVEKAPISVTQNNFPNTVHLGAIQGVTWFGMPRIDLLIGGSPCQDISNLNKFRLGLDGEKSSLFFHWYRLWRDLNPKYFLLENVVGKASAVRQISELLGVEPVKIDSSVFVPQSRNRYYWTNIPIAPLPSQDNRVLDDLLHSGQAKYIQSDSWHQWWERNKEMQIKKSYSTLDAQRAGCLTARMYASWNGNFITTNAGIRRLSPVECERLQGVPDNYSICATDAQRYKMLGNGWTVGVIAHILKGIPC